MFIHGNKEATIGVKYSSAYVRVASEIELTEIMRRVEFQFLAFKSSHSLIATAWMHFRIALLDFRAAAFVPRNAQMQTPSRRASGTSRSLNRQRYHGGKFGYRSWTSGMLAARRFADHTPPFGILSAFVIARHIFFLHHLTVRLLPRYVCRRAPRISHGVYSWVSYFHTRL